MKTKSYLLIIVVTIILLMAGYLISGQDGYFTRTILLSGISIVAAISMLSFWISVRSIDSENPNRFVRGVMGGTFLKFVLCIVAVGILLFATQKKLHKPDLFLLMFVYLIYTIIETASLFTLSRANK